MKLRLNQMIKSLNFFGFKNVKWGFFMNRNQSESDVEFLTHFFPYKIIK